MYRRDEAVHPLYKRLKIGGGRVRSRQEIFGAALATQEAHLPGGEAQMLKRWGKSARDPQTRRPAIAQGCPCLASEPSAMPAKICR